MFKVDGVKRLCRVWKDKEQEHTHTHNFLLLLTFSCNDESVMSSCVTPRKMPRTHRTKAGVFSVIAAMWFVVHKYVLVHMQHDLYIY